MELESIVVVVTFLVTFVLGEISKKNNWVKTNVIPLQNLCIGLFVGLIAYFSGIYTNLLNAIVISLAGSLGAGGVYDLIKKGSEKNVSNK